MTRKYAVAQAREAVRLGAEHWPRSARLTKAVSNPDPSPGRRRGCEQGGPGRLRRRGPGLRRAGRRWGAGLCLCDAATRDVSGVAYLYCDGDGTWAESVADCASAGYRLALPENAGEMAFIGESGAALQLPGYWLALSDAETEQNWKDLDGAPPLFVNWAPLEPSPVPDADCLDVLDGGAETWSAVPCDGSGAHVCEARP